MEKHYLCTRPWSTEVYPGRFISVIGAVPDWVIGCAIPHEGPVTGAFLVNTDASAKEEAAARATFAEIPAPPLKRPEMRQLLNTDDDLVLNFAMDHFKLPKARLSHEFGHDLLNPIGHCEVWDRRAVTEWLREARRVFGPIVNGTQKSKRFF